jgi:hypothetical protein
MLLIILQMAERIIHLENPLFHISAGEKLMAVFEIRISGKNGERTYTARGPEQKFWPNTTGTWLEQQIRRDQCDKIVSKSGVKATSKSTNLSSSSL